MPNLIGSYEPGEVTERRRRARTRVRWQVRFLQGEDVSGFLTTTQNLSSEGFYCLSPVLLRPGDRTLCILEVPTNQSSGILLLKCKAQVIRVEPVNPDGFYGVGCHIEDYWFRRSREDPAMEVRTKAPG
jgi:PilZ domain